LHYPRFLEFSYLLLATIDGNRLGQEDGWGQWLARLFSLRGSKQLYARCRLLHHNYERKFHTAGHSSLEKPDMGWQNTAAPFESLFLCVASHPDGSDFLHVRDENESCRRWINERRLFGETAPPH